MRSRSIVIAAGTLVGVTSVVMIAGVSGWQKLSDPDRAVRSGQQCLALNIKRGPQVMPDTIRAFQLAGIHLRMPQDRAVELLKASTTVFRDETNAEPIAAIRGKAPWKYVAEGGNFRAGTLGIPQSAFGSDGWMLIGVSPDNAEKPLVTFLTYSPTSATSTQTQDVIDLMRSRLGPPTVQYDSLAECGGATMVWGSDSKIEDPDSITMFGACSTVPRSAVAEWFPCNRKNAPRKPWIALRHNSQRYYLQIQAADDAYLTRYPAAYEKSYAISAKKWNIAQH